MERIDINNAKIAEVTEYDTGRTVYIKFYSKDGYLLDMVDSREEAIAKVLGLGLQLVSSNISHSSVETLYFTKD